MAEVIPGGVGTPSATAGKLARQRHDAERPVSWRDRAVGLIARALSRSYSYRYVGLANRLAAERGSGQNSGSYILAMWHTHAFSGATAHAFQRYAPLISKSRDGELTAVACSMLGLTPVRGSSSRGAQEGLFALFRMVRAGYPCALTVDGPRGPRLVVKPGIVEVARRTGIAILPMVAIPNRTWKLRRSWDNLSIPKLFATVTVIYGEPIRVAADMPNGEIERVCTDIRGKLLDLDPSVH